MTAVSEELALAQKSKPGTKHGHTAGGYSPTYHSWQAMLGRSRYASRDVENKYIGRGIAVCTRWLVFENFLADMGERPEGTTLDRFPDNDGNYGPSNCKWSTPREQARNRRNAKLDFETAVAVALRRLGGESCRSVAAHFNISESLPREIVKGRTWPDALALAKQIIAEQSDG